MGKRGVRGGFIPYLEVVLYPRAPQWLGGASHRVRCPYLEICNVCIAQATGMVLLNELGNTT